MVNRGAVDQCCSCYDCVNMCSSGFVFFFQAEDGIRDVAVTGVQTCALPISFELGKMFAPNGEIFEEETIRRLIDIPEIKGMKHSSLDRLTELRRLELRDAQRPDFRINRKSTRLNSSHGYISYAVFCLKKKKYHDTAALS